MFKTSSSQAFFRDVIVPQRTRDIGAEETAFKKYGKRVRIYRKVQPYETDISSEPFPVFTAGIRTFAHFGIGIGIYYLQLLVLCLSCLIGGLILAVALNEYKSSDYGITSSSNPFVPISGACESPIDVTVNFGCPDGAATCIGKYRENCELPFRAGAADLAMSVFMLFAIVASKFLENIITEELDEAIQTAQDYSVVVNDPDPDADNPDEWYEFFSRFGKVRYVTITRKNHVLTDLIALKHSIAKKLDQTEKHLSEKRMQKKHTQYLKQISEVNTQIEIAYKIT